VVKRLCLWLAICVGGVGEAREAAVELREIALGLDEKRYQLTPECCDRRVVRCGQFVDGKAMDLGQRR
jgi:hypothetical protein